MSGTNPTLGQLPTIDQALTSIGIALANDSLKLSQAEHIGLLASYKVLSDFVDQYKPKPEPTAPDEVEKSKN